jgi:hypothetical protein
MKTEIVNIMEYSEVDKLVVEHLLGGIPLPLYDEFSVVALGEYGNDEAHYFPGILGSYVKNEYYKKYTLPAIEKFISERKYKPFDFSTGDILVYLCSLGVLQDGNYLVIVSW